ncbi:DMT family transporter [Paracoccus onubensis]|uniref:DMT family transporter n=1 Tax=Paracoccus onubensis TaxID=1675788 RepID=A0A418SPR6_9RHOB|nr:DMT family transporter [Paracoccus onubensis]RJE82929.1 DMT family transporter [Paracoccus onubensis]
MSDNFRAALLMILSMALFALEDAFIKLLTLHLPISQILMTSGFLGALLFGLRMARRGQRLWSRALLRPVFVIRNLGEAIGAVGFVAALALGEMATAAAILQLLPLTIMMGAALFLGEKVGWRRWISVAMGFAGMLLILRPGTEAFQSAALWALLSVAALTMRDLATRRIAAEIPSDLLSAAAYASIVPAGFLLAVTAGQAPVNPGIADWAYLAGMVLFGVFGYSALVTSTRIGEAAAVAPFRYSRLAFALIVAVVFFSERPDAPTLIGAALIAASGCYAMWREARLREASPQPPDGMVRRGEP